MDILEIKNNTIIVCSNNEKKNLLKKLNESDKLLPIKFLSKSDFIKTLTFSYDEKNPQPRQIVITRKRVKEMFPFMENIEYKVGIPE